MASVVDDDVRTTLRHDVTTYHSFVPRRHGFDVICNCNIDFLLENLHDSSTKNLSVARFERSENRAERYSLDRRFLSLVIFLQINFPSYMDKSSSSFPFHLNESIIFCGMFSLYWEYIVPFFPYSLL